MRSSELERRVGDLEDACYADLSYLERFRLSVEAAARDDIDVAERLWQACPTKLYRQADAAYSGRVRAAELICLAVYADLNCLLRSLRAAEAIGALLPGLIDDAMTNAYCAGYADAGGDLADVELESEEEIAENGKLMLERGERIRASLRRVLSGDAAAVWEGFCRFAREDVGIDPEVLARAFMPPLGDARLLLTEAEPDHEKANEDHETLKQLWKQRLELYGTAA